MARSGVGRPFGGFCQVWGGFGYWSEHRDSDGVPLPTKRVKHDYPYEQLEVGESFVVQGVGMNSLCNLNRVKGRKYGRKFVCRKDGEGVRIWRIE